MNRKQKVVRQVIGQTGRINDNSIVDKLIPNIPNKQEKRVREEDMESARSYATMMKADDDSFKIRELLGELRTQMNSDRGLRKRFAAFILSFLGFEILIANTILVLIGLKILELPQLMANIFFVTVFTKIVGIVIIVANNLFPKSKEDMSSLLKDLIK